MHKKTEKVRDILPDAYYCNLEDLGRSIPLALKSIPEKPVVPNSFAGYSGTPLPKKPGIKTGSNVLLLSPPKNIIPLLSPLPEDVEISTRKTNQATIVLQFNASKKELETQFQQPHPLWRKVDASG